MLLVLTRQPLTRLRQDISWGHKLVLRREGPEEIPGMDLLMPRQAQGTLLEQLGPGQVKLTAWIGIMSVEDDVIPGYSLFELRHGHSESMPETVACSNEMAAAIYPPGDQQDSKLRSGQNTGTRTGSLKQWVKLALQTRKHMNPQLEAFFPIFFPGASQLHTALSMCDSLDHLAHACALHSSPTLSIEYGLKQVDCCEGLLLYIFTPWMQDVAAQQGADCTQEAKVNS